jgi:hypothetical protein
MTQIIKSAMDDTARKAFAGMPEAQQHKFVIEHSDLAESDNGVTNKDILFAIYPAAKSDYLRYQIISLLHALPDAKKQVAELACRLFDNAKNAVVQLHALPLLTGLSTEELQKRVKQFAMQHLNEPETLNKIIGYLMAPENAALSGALSKVGLPDEHARKLFQDKRINNPITD